MNGKVNKYVDFKEKLVFFWLGVLRVVYILLVYILL